MFKEKLKALSENNKNSGDNKKKIENLVFLIIVLIITIVIINYIWNGKDKNKSQSTNSVGKELASISVSDTQSQSSNDNLEARLENILKNIDGVGSVKVFINYSESTETVAMYNENSKTSTTEEKDKSGGVKKTETVDSQKEVVYQDDNGSKKPIIQKTVEPKIEGAIITEEGANNTGEKTSIIQAVEAATGLPTHKIQVFEMNK